MSNVYICSDLHFNHKNIIAYENRPWPDRDAMNAGLIARWNYTVNPDDIVYMLGDVGFCGKTKASELVHQLNGYKILVLGNHDRGRSDGYWEDVGFDEVYNAYHLMCGDKHVFMNHEPPEEMKPGIFYIYGHVHGEPGYPNWTEQSACVCIERLNYAPALLDDVISGKAYSDGYSAENKNFLRCNF